MKQTQIVEFIRNPQTKQPRGVVVAIRQNDEVFYGYSLLNTTMDRFDKKLGVNIAVHRALNTNGYQLPKVDNRLVMVLDAFNRLEARSLKYFKDIDPSKVKLMPSNVKSNFMEE